MSTYAEGGRQGKGTIVAGIAAVGAGMLMQTLNVYTFSTQAPMELGSTGGFGSAALVSGISGLLIMGGIVLTIVGIIRYSQSGQNATLAQPTPAFTPAASPNYCSSCGAKLVGEGRFCAACGTRAG